MYGTSYIIYYNMIESPPMANFVLKISVPKIRASRFREKDSSKSY